ncbi:MAG: LytTR family transcriptional regulator, partial [Eubacterium sp.]|nr:LytTR family transcriptional regulator [Eubacterium sp.]
GCTRRVKVNDIYHVESNRKKVVLHHIDGIEETVQKLNEIEKLLPDYFLRIHQSFLVNMNYVKSISAYTLETTNGFILPISRSKSKYARDRFMEFLSMNN